MFRPDVPVRPQSDELRRPPPPPPGLPPRQASPDAKVLAEALHDLANAVRELKSKL